MSNLERTTSDRVAFKDNGLSRLEQPDFVVLNDVRLEDPRRITAIAASQLNRRTSPEDIAVYGCGSRDKKWTFPAGYREVVPTDGHAVAAFNVNILLGGAPKSVPLDQYDASTLNLYVVFTDGFPNDVASNGRGWLPAILAEHLHIVIAATSYLVALDQDVPASITHPN